MEITKVKGAESLYSRAVFLKASNMLESPRNQKKRWVPGPQPNTGKSTVGTRAGRAPARSWRLSDSTCVCVAGELGNLFLWD